MLAAAKKTGDEEAVAFAEGMVHRFGGPLLDGGSGAPPPTSSTLRNAEQRLKQCEKQLRVAQDSLEQKQAQVAEAQEAESECSEKVAQAKEKVERIKAQMAGSTGTWTAPKAFMPEVVARLDGILAMEQPGREQFNEILAEMRRYVCDEPGDEGSGKTESDEAWSGELRSKVNCASPHARWGVRLPLAPWTLHALTVSPAIELDGPYPTNFPTAEPSRSSTRSHVALKHGAPNPERGIGRAGGGGSDRAENENDAVRPIAAAPVVATAAMPLAASPSP